MKKRILRFIATIAIMLLGINSVAYAVQIEFHTFENPQRERLYLDLIAELRCVKCQNQNLAESDAELAKDMRDKTYEMITKGKSRDDVVNYMTARYGDFVLYKPPFKTKTFLLWVGPPLLLVFSLFFILRIVRQQPEKAVEKLNDDDRESIRNMLKTKDEK